MLEKLSIVTPGIIAAVPMMLVVGMSLTSIAVVVLICIVFGLLI